MKRMLSKKSIGLTVAALLLTATISLPGTMAYFTTYTSTSGSKAISFQTSTKIHEDVVDMTKQIAIENTGSSKCFVRVKVISPFDVTYNMGDGWTNGGDGYYYYQTELDGVTRDDEGNIIAAGGMTTRLDAHIEVPADYVNAFDVTVVQESSIAIYNGDTDQYEPSDWTISNPAI